MTDDKINRIRNIFMQHALLAKTSVLRKNKVCSRDIVELLSAGYIVKVKTGYYAWRAGFDQLHDFEVIQGLIPRGVISVFSAAAIHELTTVNPIKISVTISGQMLRPKMPDYPPVDLFYISDQYLELGVIEYPMEHALIRLYNQERTVCDFFKYSAKIDHDAALEVLRSYMSRKMNLSLLFEYATKLRVKKYIKPYVEALL